MVVGVTYSVFGKGLGPKNQKHKYGRYPPPRNIQSKPKCSWSKNRDCARIHPLPFPHYRRCRCFPCSVMLVGHLGKKRKMMEIVVARARHRRVKASFRHDTSSDVSGPVSVHAYICMHMYMSITGTYGSSRWTSRAGFVGRHNKTHSSTFSDVLCRLLLLLFILLLREGRMQWNATSRRISKHDAESKT